MKVNLREIESLLQGVPLTPNLGKYLTHNPLKRKGIERFVDDLLSIMSKLKPNVIGDIGCGEGIILYHISKQGLCKSLVGVDISREALGIAKRIVGSSVNLILADAQHIPLRRVDLVVAVELLEHLPDPTLAVNEIAHTADHAIITVPYTILFRVACLLSLKNIENLGEDTDHKHSYNPKKLKKLLDPMNIILQKRAGAWLLALTKSKKV